MKTPRLVRFAVPALLLATTACTSAYYSTMEKFGVHKRDILVDRVEDARADQEDAKEQFQSTFEAFQALTSFEGGELEDLYERLNDEYEDSVDSASDVRGRIESIEKVSVDLFEEWEGEIEEITDSDLQSKSRGLMRDTKQRYDGLIVKMTSAADAMDPVLETFKNNVLFLKHNLNAQAISSLKDTSVEIESDVAALIARMQDSIDEANDFIETMGS